MCNCKTSTSVQTRLYLVLQETCERGVGDADIERLCEEARQQLGGDTVCQLANYLFPQVRSTQ
jgi:hypothetical protein